VVDSYLRDAPERIAALHAALAAHDAKTLTREAHTLKSSSATVGATEIAAIAADLERSAPSASADAVTAQIDQLAELLARVTPVFEGEVERRSPLAGRGDPDGHAGGAGDRAPRGIDRRGKSDG
jgi:HPt (histidine-containing phosphotransfer) domain-containing protein